MDKAKIQFYRNKAIECGELAYRSYFMRDYKMYRFYENAKEGFLIKVMKAGGRK